MDAWLEAGYDDAGADSPHDHRGRYRLPGARSGAPVLGRDALRIIAIGAESRYVHEGNALFGEGEDADAPMWCRKARSISSREKGGRRHGRGRGALIGEIALLTETKRPVTAVAREPSSVVRIPRQLFLKMLEGYPDAARAHARRDRGARSSQTAGEFARVRDGAGARRPTRK